MTRIADLLERDFSGPIEKTVKAHNDDPELAQLQEPLKVVLRKKKSQEFILRELFRNCGASLKQNVKLERSKRPTEFDEDPFVQFYPYLPHLIDLSIDIAAGIRLHPSAPKHPDRGNRTIIEQSFEMLASQRTRLADQPVGVLVSIDKIYEVVEETLPIEKRKDVLNIRQRFDGDKDYPGMAGRVAKAICLMEFVKTDLPRTMENIARLLIQDVTEAPPILAVTAMLYFMQQAQFARETEDGWTLLEFDELRRAPDALEGLKNGVGAVNPRPPGWHNDVIQAGKKLCLRGLAWYTRPQHDFNAFVSRTLGTIIWALDHLSRTVAANLSTSVVAFDRLSMDLVALQRRLAESEKRNATLAESMRQMQGQLDLLRQEMQAANLEAPAIQTDGRQRAGEDATLPLDTGLGNGRTVYVIGLFGSGRRYINELILHNTGERAKYFRDTIRLHPGPTPMIYSGHATLKYVSRGQEPPAIMSRILEAVRAGFADLIFVHRHPLDSLLTNWIYWRTFLRDNRSTGGIYEVYESRDNLCGDLEREFREFKAFAEGDPDFFSGAPGPRFLSFAEYVEETELHQNSATLTLRLEDFTIDPLKEFSKILEVVSDHADVGRLSLALPIAKPYNHLTVKEQVPQFRNFVDGLDATTRRRIENIGYTGH
jgi:cell division protein FtsB